MSEEQKEQVTEPQTTVNVKEDAPKAESDVPSVDIPELEYGYVVGVQPDGGFVFQTVGAKQGLVQMLGVHQYAKHRLDVATDINQQYGYPLLAQQVHNLTEMVKVMLNMVSSAQGAPQGEDKRIVTL